MKTALKVLDEIEGLVEEMREDGEHDLRTVLHLTSSLRKEIINGEE